MLRSLAQNVIDNGHSHVNAVALRGDTKTELEKAIIKLNATFVVVGTRGYGTGFKESISNHLVHSLEIPVLVVPWFLNDQ
jgi:nucleotide-binding universal stress UspA family protein